MSSFLTATATYRPRSDMGQFIAAKITPAVRASVEAASKLIVDEAKSIAPVKTGALRDSISATVVDGESTVIGTISADVPYAGYVEFGVGVRGAASPGRGPYPYGDRPGQVAQPYMRPALDTTRDAVRAVFASQIAIGLKS